MAILKKPVNTMSKLPPDPGPAPGDPQQQYQQQPRSGLMSTFFGGGSDNGSGWGNGYDDDPRSRINKLGAMLMMLDPMTANAGTSMLQLEQNRASTNYAMKRQNHTANWLQTQGLGEQEAAFVASDPDALKEWYKQRTEMKTPKWEMHEMWNAQHQKVQAMVDMHTGKFSTIGGSAPPTLSIESGFNTDGREYKYLFNHDDGSQIPLAGQGAKTDEMSPGRLAQETQLRKATQPSVVMQGENAESKSVGEMYGKAFGDYRKANENSQGMLSNLDLMEGLVRSPNFQSGAGGTFKMNVQKLAKSMGFSDDDIKAVGNKELFDAMSSRMTLDALGGTLGTGISNEDRNTIKKTVAGLDTSRGGNLAIIELQRLMQSRAQDVWEQARAYRKANGKLDEDFDAQLDQWRKANPLMTPENVAHIVALGKSDPTMGGNGSGVGDGASGGDASAQQPPKGYHAIEGHPGIWEKD
jgi:hypothetical protein